MYLHENREDFRDIIEQVADITGKTGVIVEKDYYVTMILHLLAEKLPGIVFKGGTSLSKGFHVINRFSEDIDITFNEHIGESRRKKLKNVVINGISEALGMPIINWGETQSDRDYNAYFFSYKSVYSFEDDRVTSVVKLETALGSYSFPTEMATIGNYIGDYLISLGRKDIAAKFMLEPFEMQLQSLSRTYIDKIFALCDYYMQGRSKRCSRHLYDLYKLTPYVEYDDSLKFLYEEVREHRSVMKICPSAQKGVNVPKVIREFCIRDFYKEDYQLITDYFSDDLVAYDACVDRMLEIASWIEKF